MRRILLWIVVFYLRFWAQLALALHKPKVVGIAGSVGKSSARNILSSALKDHIRVKNIFGNSETGIPLGVLGIKPDGFDIFSWLFMIVRAPLGIFYIRGQKWLIIEMGIDEPYPPRNMQFLLSIVKPDIAISLNISATHTQQFEVLLREEKYKNIRGDEQHEFLLKKIAEDDVGIITKSNCNVGIYNKDDKYILDEIEKFEEGKNNTKLLSFGKDGDVEYGNYSIDLSRTKFEFMVGERKFSIDIQKHALVKEYQEIIAACLLAAREVGVGVEETLKSIEKNFSIPKGRSSLLDGVSKSIIIDSSYNASSSATIAFVEMVKTLKEKTGRDVVFLFGDMRELGEQAKMEHRKVNQHIKGVVDYLYCVGPLTKKFVIPEFEEGKMKDVKHFANSTEAGNYLQHNMPEGALVLVKGSQNTIFLEEAVKQILKNKNDVSKLCRQEDYWMEIKNHYFT